MPKPNPDLGGALERHLREWLGGWPPAGDPEVVGCDRRARPGWDGHVHPLVAVTSPVGAVVSVPPGLVEAVQRALAGGSERALAGASEPALAGGSERACAARAHRAPDRWPAALAGAVGHPGRGVAEMAFRFTEAPADLPDAGEWAASHAPGLPAWLRVFPDPVLVARDASGAYVSGVGIKRHDRFGHELAVATAPASRGAGLARRLVAQAARAVLATGAVPTYAHDRDNRASARVAEAAGFPDGAWGIVRLRDKP